MGVVIKFPGADLNFWTQIPKVPYLKTNGHRRRDNGLVRALAMAMTMTLKTHMKNSNKVFMKCETREKKELFLKLLLSYDFKYIYGVKVPYYIFSKSLYIQIKLNTWKKINSLWEIGRWLNIWDHPMYTRVNIAGLLSLQGLLARFGTPGNLRFWDSFLIPYFSFSDKNGSLYLFV